MGEQGGGVEIEKFFPNNTFSRINLYNKLFSPDRRGCPLYCDTDAVHAFQNDSFLCVGQLWYWIKPISSSLATLVDGFPGVELVGIPTGRFFFMILPVQNKKQHLNFDFSTQKIAGTARVFSRVLRRRRKMINKIPQLQQGITR